MGKGAALIIAAHANQVAVVKLRLDAGADVNAKTRLDESEQTALSVAVNNANAELIELFKKDGVWQGVSGLSDR